MGGVADVGQVECLSSLTLAGGGNVHALLLGKVPERLARGVVLGMAVGHEGVEPQAQHQAEELAVIVIVEVAARVAEGLQGAHGGGRPLEYLRFAIHAEGAPSLGGQSGLRPGRHACLPREFEQSVGRAPGIAAGHHDILPAQPDVEGFGAGYKLVDGHVQGCELLEFLVVKQVKLENHDLAVAFLLGIAACDGCHVGRKQVDGLFHHGREFLLPDIAHVLPAVKPIDVGGREGGGCRTEEEGEKESYLHFRCILVVPGKVTENQPHTEIY